MAEDEDNDSSYEPSKQLGNEESVYVIKSLTDYSADQVSVHEDASGLVKSLSDYSAHEAVARQNELAELEEDVTLNKKEAPVESF